MKRSLPFFNFAICLVLAVGPAVADPAPANDAEPIGPNTLVANAKTAMTEGKYQMAWEAINMFLDKHLDDPRVEEMIQMRAVCAVRIGRPTEGIPILEQMLEGEEDLATQASLHELLGDAKGNTERSRFAAADHYRQAGERFHELDQPGEILAANAWSKAADLYAKYLDWRRSDASTPATEDQLRQLRLERIVDALDHLLDLDIDRELRQSTLQRKALAFRVYSPEPAKNVDDMLACYDAILDINDHASVAGEALFDAAALLIEHKHDYVAASRNYSRLLDFFPKLSKEKRIQKLLDRIVQPSFSLKTDHAFSPTEDVLLDWEARNIDSVTLSAYPVELISLMRQIGRARDLDKWSPSGEPARRWTVELPNPGQYGPMASRQNNAQPIAFPDAKPGAYVVVGRSGEVVSKRLLIVSRLAALVKTGTLETLVFVTDRETGQPVENAEILLQDRAGVKGFDYITGKTDQHGIYRRSLTRRAAGRQRSRTGTAIIRAGDHYAVVSHGFFWRRWGYPGTHRVYGFTDRPVYFPGQRVHFKQIVRTASRGMYGNWAGRALPVSILDPAGHPVHEVQLTTNPQGSTAAMFTLPAKAAPGLYTIRATIGKTSFGPKESPGNQFLVASADQPVVDAPAIAPPAPAAPPTAGDLVITPERNSYVDGETARVRITSKLPAPAALITAESDALLFAQRVDLRSGQATVDIPVRGAFAPNFFVKATVVRANDVLEDRVQIIVPQTQAFITVQLITTPASPAPGEKVKLRIRTQDAAGQGCPAEVAVTMVDAALLDAHPVFRDSISNYFHGDLRPLLVQTHRQYIYFTGGLLPIASIDRPERPALAHVAPKGKVSATSAETALWRPSIVTDGAGVAEIEIQWPKRPATWRLTAIAIDQHGRAGEISLDHKTK